MRGYQRTHRAEHLPSALLWPFMHLRSMVPLVMAPPSREWLDWLCHVGWPCRHGYRAIARWSALLGVWPAAHVVCHGSTGGSRQRKQRRAKRAIPAFVRPRRGLFLGCICASAGFRRASAAKLSPSLPGWRVSERSAVSRLAISLWSGAVGAEQPL